MPSHRDLLHCARVCLTATSLGVQKHPAIPTQAHMLCYIVSFSTEADFVISALLELRVGADYCCVGNTGPQALHSMAVG